jgi:hypothetical protein
MTDGEKLHFLAGEANGMRMVIMALVNSHSDPQALQVRVQSSWPKAEVATAPLTSPASRMCSSCIGK